MRNTTTTGRHAPISYATTLVVPSVSKAFNAQMAEWQRLDRLKAQAEAELEKFCADNAGKYRVIAGSLSTYSEADVSKVAKISADFAVRYGEAGYYDPFLLLYRFQDAENVRVNPNYHWEQWMLEMECKAMGLS